MRKDPLDAVKMLAEISELKKSREVADSIVNLSAARERLVLLQTYLDEYAARSGDGATDIERLKSQQTFLSALAQAIGDQSASIEQTHAVLERRIELWRTARANTQAVSRLTEKRAQARRQRDESREQSELDAAGQRRPG
jgi:flagellar export protein FliJ